MATEKEPTLASVKAARAAVKSQGRVKRAPAKKQYTMVYLLEVRVPLDGVGEFESEHLEDSLTQYGSCDVIEKGVVEAAS